jgi:hypothetical protein
MRRLVFVLPFVPLLASIAVVAQQGQNVKPDQTSTQVTNAELDRMAAAGKSPAELALYVFETQGCKSCHTLGQDGKLGYTETGKLRATGFEGCINMLTAMTVIVQVSEEKRTPLQHQKAERFGEFGCTQCHKLTPGNMSLTELGSKLKHMNLGCVEVEKLASAK